MATHIITTEDLNIIKSMNHDILLASSSKPGKKLIFRCIPSSNNNGHYIVMNQTGLIVHTSDYLGLAARHYNTLP